MVFNTSSHLQHKNQHFYRWQNVQPAPVFKPMSRRKCSWRLKKKKSFTKLINFELWKWKKRKEKHTVQTFMVFNLILLLRKKKTKPINLKYCLSQWSKSQATCPWGKITFFRFLVSEWKWWKRFFWNMGDVAEVGDLMRGSSDISVNWLQKEFVKALKKPFIKCPSAASCFKHSSSFHNNMWLKGKRDSWAAGPICVSGKETYARWFPSFKLCNSSQEECYFLQSIGGIEKSHRKKVKLKRYIYKNYL